MDSFDEFATRFFTLFTGAHFKNVDLLRYLERAPARRAGDEASIVDNAIIGPLLGLLGFAPGEQRYNQQNKDGRPDFAPRDPNYGTCFVVEDKSTAIELTLNVHDPESHLSQLSGCLRSRGLRSGWVTNGKQLTVWQFDDPLVPVCTIDLDVVSAVREWSSGGLPSVSPNRLQAIRRLWDQFRRETFSDLQRLEREIGLEFEDWKRQALPVGAHNANQEQLVGALKALLQDLHVDARAQLDDHLASYDTYRNAADRTSEDSEELASSRLEQKRNRIAILLERLTALVGLEPREVEDILADIRALERDAHTFVSSKHLLGRVLATINLAKSRKFATSKNESKPWTKFDNGLGELGDTLQDYAETAFASHARQATLRQTHRSGLEAHDHYTSWASLVQETMLGGMDDDRRRSEFALQASYVVLMRLLLLRVCEDKGIFPHRFISDGGLRRWQEDIDRYFFFATGNPYDTLLDMAYQNAQNIYAHFFTGRELFNWYSLDRLRLVRVLYQLSRFDFADVDADLIGTIYSTYVERPEKKQKGQYYTPPEVVRYILDEVGYTAGPNIVGANKRLIDPACGSGTFLIEAARRLVASYLHNGATANPRQLLDRVRESIYGFDLNPFACYLAEVNLLIQVMDLVKLAIDGNNPPRLQRFHIYNVDALSPPGGEFRFARSDTFMAEELDVVDRAKGRQGEYQTGFAWVVANPPYGAKLTDAYKLALREWMGDVFYGQPDTYVFFFQLALRLLGPNGRLGFITPNTYLMGTNTAALRGLLLAAGRMEQIVDLPQGIWKDANVDCALLFLACDADIESRRAQQTRVYSMAVRDKLDLLTERYWQETFTHSQGTWMDDPRHEINIRWTPLLEKIETACLVATDGAAAPHVLRLGEVVKINRGIEPYRSKQQGAEGAFIKPQDQLTSSERGWKPLIDSQSQLARYGLQWHRSRPHLNYGPWLYRAYEPVYYDSPKILFISIRNRALTRRLVGTYDDKGFYNRHNYSDIISGDSAYDLKYILALFNSALLNYWYGRQYPEVNIAIVDIRQLPIYPADRTIQAELVALVDRLLADQEALNALRQNGYSIRVSREGTTQIEVPYDLLLEEMRGIDPHFPVLTLFDARAAGLVTLPPDCDTSAQISRVYIPEKSPRTLVLRAGQLWLDIDDESTREFLANALARPQWKGRSWDEISGRALLPETAVARLSIISHAREIVSDIQKRVTNFMKADAELDERILDLYGITSQADRQLVLGRAAIAEEDDATEDDGEAGIPT